MKRMVLAAISCLASGAALADSPLADSIQDGRRDVAVDLLAKGADANAAQGDGATPLHWATYKLDVDLVKKLLDAGADVNAVNRYGSSPLTEAVKAANTELVRILLDAGADANARNLDGETALMLAARTGSLDVTKRLVERGADVNARETWREQTALMWAAESAHAEVTEYLVAHGADVRARSAVNDWAVQVTSEPRAQYRPTGGFTPLLLAARSGCGACARAILAGGEDIDRPTPDGVTALMLAIDNFEFDTAKLLLDAGANPHVADWWGRTALYLAVDMNDYIPRTPAYPRSQTVKGIDLARQLLAAGVDVNPQLNMHRPGRGGNSQRFTDDLLTTGATPLLRAAITHDHESLRALIEHGAIVDLPNVMGVTPLMAAAGIGVRNQNFGSNRSPNFEGDTTVEERAIGSLEILLAAGANIDARVTDLKSRTARIARLSSMTDRTGQTALFSAASRGWTSVVAFLVEHGASVDIVDGLGRSPLDVALGRVGGRTAPGSEIVAKILEDAGGKTGAITPKL